MALGISPVRPAKDNLANTGSRLPNTSAEVDGREETLGIVTGQASRDVSSSQLDKAVRAMNDTVTANNLHFQFSVHEGTHRVIVQVVDKETEQVIQEIPPEKILDIISEMGDMLGVLVDEKA